MPELISLFTDASYSQHTLRGGWGAWARTTYARVYNGGGIYQDIQDATVAELYAVWEGLLMCHRVGIISQENYGCRVLVQTDNLRVATMLPVWDPHKGGPIRTHKRPPPRFQVEEDLMTKIEEMVNTYDLMLCGRHIKGHQDPSKTTRNYVNNLCDDLAGKGRKRAEGVKITPHLDVPARLHNPDKQKEMT